LRTYYFRLNRFTSNVNRSTLYDIILHYYCLLQNTNEYYISQRKSLSAAGGNSWNDWSRGGGGEGNFKRRRRRRCSRSGHRLASRHIWIGRLRFFTSGTDRARRSGFGMHARGESPLLQWRRFTHTHTHTQKNAILTAVIRPRRWFLYRVYIILYCMRWIESERERETEKKTERQIEREKGMSL